MTKELEYPNLINKIDPQDWDEFLLLIETAPEDVLKEEYLKRCHNYALNILEAYIKSIFVISNQLVSTFTLDKMEDNAKSNQEVFVPTSTVPVV